MNILASIGLALLSHTHKREVSFLLIGLILWGTSWLIPLNFLQGIPRTLLLLEILPITIIICLFSIFLRIRPDLIPFLQVLWDKKGNVYCPHCRTILIQTQEECNDDKRIHALKCMNKNCNQESIFLRDDSGHAMRLRLAKKNLADKLGIKIELDQSNN